MKIASSAVQLDSNHVSQKQHSLKETLNFWKRSRPDDTQGQQIQPSASAQNTASSVQISNAGKTAQSGEASAIEESIKAVENDPMLRLIRSMIAMLTGEEVKVFDASELQSTTSTPDLPAPDQSNPPNSPQAQQQTPQQPAGYGVEYDRQESYSESEQTSFQASGVVRTTDGKEISFSLSLSMSRSYQEDSTISLRLGDARQKKDPLVINFGGSAAQLTSQRFKFDLDSDGQTDDINFVAGGSGFLALDRNGDGKINNGSELFGAQSGNGFAELSALDSDQNGWIDENDAAYSQLRVWTKDNAGKDQLSTLKQADVGAISLARVETPFDIKTASNDLQGQIKASGIYLKEGGGAGSVQQIDLTV